MRFSRTRSIKRKLLVAVTAALALFAIGSAAASSAQAEGLSDSNFRITGNLGGEEVEITCSSAATEDEVFDLEPGPATIMLSGCAAAQPLDQCTIPPIAINAATSFHKVEGSLYELFTPTEENRFGIVKFVGSSCPFNEVEAALKGSFAGLGPQGEEPSRTLSFSPAINAAAGAVLSLGKAPAAMSGALVHLTEPTEMNWVAGAVPFGPADEDEVNIAGGPIDFELSAWGSPMTISCSNVGADAATLKGGGTEDVSFVFSGCELAGYAHCEVPETIVFEPVHAELQFAGAKAYQVFSSDDPRGTLAVVPFEGCGDAFRISGSFAGAGPKYPFARVTQPLEFSSAAESATGSRLYFDGGWFASMRGSLLQGLQSGQAWGVYYN